ncbi:hypothetical protein, partial [Bradyrhizobium sp. Leo121]|uniref:hypothetical protein n=1 Tax=Bradyrhizobium sp. Leo121 TaxID=1571195 RepID=UPI0010D4605C
MTARTMTGGLQLTFFLAERSNPFRRLLRHGLLRFARNDGSAKLIANLDIAAAALVWAALRGGAEFEVAAARDRPA